jgi:hypothetical protein
MRSKHDLLNYKAPINLCTKISTVNKRCGPNKKTNPNPRILNCFYYSLSKFGQHFTVLSGNGNKMLTQTACSKGK